MKNVYYLIFKKGGFELIMADTMETTHRDYVFKEKDPKRGGEVVVAKWPKEMVKSVEENPEFGVS